MRIRLLVILAALTALAVLGSCSACKKKSGRRKKVIDPAYVQAHLLAAVPDTLTNKLDVDLGGKVIYAGNEVVGGTVLAPGSKVQVKHYWKVVEAPGTDWKVFAHLYGAAPGGAANGTGGGWKNLDVSDMRLGYGPDKWKAGDVVEDIQDVSVDAGWTSPTATLVVGLYRKGSTEHLPIVGGSREGNVTAVQFTVDRSKAPGTPPPYVVRRTTGAIVVDGVADEADWKSAPSSPQFANAEGSPEAQGSAAARLLWDDTNLYVFISVSDDDVFSEFTADDDTLWKADVVELFIDADGNRRGYVELQVNPNNAKLDSWFATTRGKPGDQAWSASMTSAVQVHGTPTRGDNDLGWDVEIAIPLVAAKGGDAAMRVAIPPAVGDSWKLNVVRVEKPADGKVSASSWSPITYRDFHGIDRLLTVTFGTASGESKAAPPVAPPAGADGDAGTSAGSAATAPGAPATDAGPTAPLLSHPRKGERGSTLAKPPAGKVEAPPTSP